MFGHKKENKVDWTKVYLWNAKTPEGKLTTSEIAAMKGWNVGHVSTEVQTEERHTYFSFWPKHGVNSPKQRVDGIHHENLQHDIKCEGGNPDLATIFFKLDNQAMIKKGEELSKEWSAKIKMNPNLADDSKENCTSFSYKVLVSGGVNLFSPKCKALENSIGPMTPDKLRACIEDAKKYEETQFPETKNYEGIRRIPRI